jgi:hypothetical protein
MSGGLLGRARLEQEAEDGSVAVRVAARLERVDRELDVVARVT